VREPWNVTAEAPPTFQANFTPNEIAADLNASLFIRNKSGNKCHCIIRAADSERGTVETWNRGNVEPWKRGTVESWIRPLSRYVNN
jgi:hypothetical protein